MLKAFGTIMVKKIVAAFKSRPVSQGSFGDSFTKFGGKAWKMVNSYNTRSNVQAATHDISGVRDKMFGQSDGEEEGRVGDQSVVPDFFSHAHRVHATGIVGKRPRAAGSYDERNDAVTKVRGKSGGGNAGG